MVNLEIVASDIPDFLGIEILDEEFLMADKVTKIFIHRVVISQGHEIIRYVVLWSMSMKRNDNHVYAETSLGNNTFYTRNELQKLYRKFCHP